METIINIIRDRDKKLQEYAQWHSKKEYKYNYSLFCPCCGNWVKHWKDRQDSDGFSPLMLKTIPTKILDPIKKIEQSSITLWNCNICGNVIIRNGLERI
jgi:hypothetical protein